ncbi:GntR family transcriptional regulator, partial [Mycobacteroides abscessus]|uniref:GntR family transcriptional regulator n=1 Tax=Mycobacteroides abscessus TaxID=36809 RepID=UPI00188E2C6D
MHPRLSSQSLAEQVANILAAQIGDGRWSTGVKLPGEVALCEEFGVSRATVRKAIRDLKTKGLASTRQGAGAFGTSVRPLWQGVRVLAAAEMRAGVEGG